MEVAAARLQLAQCAQVHNLAPLVGALAAAGPNAAASITGC
jgi:hypothetical protein